MRTRDGNRWRSQTQAPRSGRVRPAEMLEFFLNKYVGRPLAMLAAGYSGFAVRSSFRSATGAQSAPFYPYAIGRAAAQQGAPHEPMYSPAAAQRSKLRWPILCFVFLSFFVGFNSQKSSAQSCDTLKVLSYNIQLLPRPWVRVKQPIRAKQIAHSIAECDFDVVVFQEAFSRKQRRKMYDILRDKYPYQETGQIKRFIQLNNGIWMISKYPISVVFEKRYKNASGIDKIASKGVLGIEVNASGKRVQICGTHLQAGNAKRHRKNREQQMKALLTSTYNYGKPLVPQIVAGDLNVRRKSKLAFFKKWTIFNKKRLGTYSTRNSWNTHHSDELQEAQLDYILLRPNNTNARIKNHQLYNPSFEYRGKKMDAADHYGISADVILCD